MSSSSTIKITIIGAGTIGLSFAALELAKDPNAHVTIFDVRSDLSSYVSQHLPSYLGDVDADATSCMKRLSFASDLQSAVKDADIVQEQGPENIDFKTKTWQQVEESAPAHTLFWSSTSGLPASQQNKLMKDKSRLLIVHPYNPPHIMPLLEVVRSPDSSDEVVQRTLAYWRKLGRTPVDIKKECVGFVANRLAGTLLHEACSLVTHGVISVKDLDDVVKASMGPRWAVQGLFRGYHAGGGEGGLKSLFEKIGSTTQQCWDASQEDYELGDVRMGGAWQADVCRQADEAYGTVDTDEVARKTKAVLKAAAS